MKIVSGPPSPKGPVFGKHKDYVMPTEGLSILIFTKNALKVDTFYSAKEDKEILRVWK